MISNGEAHKLNSMDYPRLMHLALGFASESDLDVPVGAVIVDSKGEVIAHGRNQKEARHDASSHAEIEAIRAAGQKLGDWRLENCTLVVTLEPCVMCAGAIVAARIPRVVFGAWDPKVGAGGSLYDILRDSRLGNQVEVVGGVLDEECSSLLEQFFDTRREN
jgi:tRNA(adenine34) deaminase